MKKVFLSRSILTGLSAYQYRLHLSVDRTLREEIGPFIDYCQRSTFPTLRQVLERFDSLDEGETFGTMLQDNASVPPRRVCSRLNAWLQWYIRGGVLLKESEMQFIYSTLKQLSVALNQLQTVDPKVFVPIRLHLVDGYTLCLTCIPNRTIRNRIGRVEHFHQSDWKKTMTIEAIVERKDWLSSTISIKR